MTTTIPEGVVSNAHVPVWWLPGTRPADLTAPLLSEISAALQLDCYLSGGTPIAYNKNNSTREFYRLCMTKAGLKPGTKQLTVSLTGVYDGQNVTPTENQLHVNMKEGAVGTLIVAWGLDTDAGLTAGVIADLIYGTVNTVTKNTPTTNEDLTITVELLGEEWEEDVEILAGS